MVVKVYVSGISGNKEVKKRQQRVLMILDSKNIKYDVIDITEPGKESDKDFMQNNSTSNGGTVSDPNPRSPLPPQLFNDEEYCGDYDQFDLANEIDTLEQFLKLEVPPEQPAPVENEKESTLNGDVSKTSKENSQEREATETDKSAEEKPTNEEKEKSPVKDITEKAESKEPTPARDEVEEIVKESTPEKEASPERQKSVEKEASPAKEGSPAKEVSPAKELSPAKEVSPAKELSPAKEVEEPQAVSEDAPTENESVNENGAVSSREQSAEKEGAGDADRKKDPPELLIESEIAATAD